MIILMIQHNISIDSYCRTEDNHTRCDNIGVFQITIEKYKICLFVCAFVCVWRVGGRYYEGVSVSNITEKPINIFRTIF